MGRTRNFTFREKEYFTKLIKKFAHAVECHKSDAFTIKQKEKAWSLICDEYNSLSFVKEKVRMLWLF